MVAQGNSDSQVGNAVSNSPSQVAEAFESIWEVVREAMSNDIDLTQRVHMLAVSMLNDANFSLATIARMQPGPCLSNSTEVNGPQATAEARATGAVTQSVTVSEECDTTAKARVLPEKHASTDTSQDQHSVASPSIQPEPERRDVQSCQRSENSLKPAAGSVPASDDQREVSLKISEHQENVLNQIECQRESSSGGPNISDKATSSELDAAEKEDSKRPVKHHSCDSDSETKPTDDTQRDDHAASTQITGIEEAHQLETTSTTQFDQDEKETYEYDIRELAQGLQLGNSIAKRARAPQEVNPAGNVPTSIPEPDEERSNRNERLVKAFTETVEIDRMAAIFELKGESCRWQIERASLTKFRQDQFDTLVKPRDFELVAHANRLDTVLWMKDIQHHVSNDRWESLAESFAIGGAGLELLAKLATQYPNNDDLFKQTIQLVYRLQMVLNRSLDGVASRPDRDHQLLIRELQQLSNKMGFKLNPAGMGSLDLDDCRERICDILAKFEGREKRSKEKDNLLGKLRYESDRILELEQHADWSTFNRAVADLVKLGEPESSIRIREHLEPIRYLVPESLELTPALQKAIEFYDAAQKDAATDRQAQLASDSDYNSARIQQVRKALRGRKIAILGGDARPDKVNRIQDAFECQVEWVDTHHHSHIDKFRARIERSDITLVLMLIRWSSHVYNELKSERFVKVTAGYNPNQLAEAILSQKSGLLGD